MESAAIYRTIWRWHFYAGLFVIPFVILLSVTGAIYLFKPQIELWEEGRWSARVVTARIAADADAQVAAALSAVSGSQVRNYRLPRSSEAPAAITVDVANGGQREVFVMPDGTVAAVVDPEARISAFVARLHGSLLAGRAGGILVELAGSWAIVMTLTGLYLWWPKSANGRWRAAGVLWPRLGRGSAALWRDLHAVTGIWVAGLVLVLLLTALPWTDVWANGFRLLRAEMGWTASGPQDWKSGGPVHVHVAREQLKVPVPTGQFTWNDMVVRARREALPHPALVIPPFAANRFGPANGYEWKLTSEAQNRPLIRSIFIDPETGAEIRRTGFRDKHVIDQVINYGIAWHEGQLFGLANQLIGLATALAMLVMAISGFILWRHRHPGQGLGAPLAVLPRRHMRLATPITLALAAMLPLLAASLVAMLLLEKLVIQRLPRVAYWLGVPAPTATRRG
jgi:uncharacterized iron-regulated membrane protein